MVVLDVLPGLLIEVLLSLILVVSHVSRPEVSVLGVSADVPGAYVDVERHPGAQPTDGVLIVRADGPLCYANAQGMRDAISSHVAADKDTIRVVVLDLDANDDLDITSAEQLDKLQHGLQARGIQLCLAHMHGPTLRMAKAIGLLEHLGADHVFANIDTAVAWARTRSQR